jgi:hypothetical protein
MGKAMGQGEEWGQGGGGGAGGLVEVGQLIVSMVLAWREACHCA